MIDDERGRVPFAVIAVLLLVASATVATTMAPTVPPDEPAVDVVVDRVESEHRTALRRAVREAATDAATEPVVEPANTTLGRAVGSNRTFRRSLRLRIYVAAREHLRAIERRRGDVVATAHLPPIDADDAKSVREAIEQVRLDATEPNATAIAVAIENVTTTVRRDGRVSSRQRTSPRVTVASPVIALHERVSTYEERLNAGLTEPGLERRLAVLLNAAGWTRGYAQYEGAPIDNVVSNSHVELATNAAALDVQRSTIGRVDRDAVGGLGEAIATVGAQELLAMSSGPSPFLQQALADHSVVEANEIEGLDVPTRDEPMTVGVNRTADDVFLRVVSDERLPRGYRFADDAAVRLHRIFEDAYSAKTRLATTVLDRSGGPPDPERPVGSGWEEIDTSLEQSIRVTSGPTSSKHKATGNWHVLETYSRRVVTEYERTTTWARGVEREMTHSSSSKTVSVRVAVLGDHAPNAAGPAGRIRGIHTRGTGPLDGPNLAGVEAAAIDRLIGERGGRDAIARRAAAGRVNETSITIEGSRPAGLRTWVYRDLRALREEVRTVSVAVDRRDVGTFAVNPPQLLAETVRGRRAALLDASPPYDGVADRARVASRARYLDLVVRALERRADERSENRGKLAKTLEDAGAGTIDALQRSVHATAGAPGDRQPALTGPGGPVSIRVDAAPAYLTLSAVDDGAIPAVDGETYPLAARNWNLVGLPYGEVIDGILDALLSGPDRTSLGSAARTLRSIGEVDGSLNASQLRKRTRVAESVEKKIGNVGETAVTTMADLDVGTDEERRRTIVRAALARWNGPAATGIAVSNGSAATGIVAVADERTGLTAVERDRLTLELDRAIRESLASPGGQPKMKAVRNAYETAEREVARAARAVAKDYADRAIERLTNGTISSLPKGLPLAPVPGYWYATTNVWHVEVEGEYARFGVRATRGRPSNPGAALVYARDGDAATLDVDGDDAAERLGNSRRVQFSATVDVVVVVPPGARGVGDVAGPMDERSPGWDERGE